jgi:hypothetical protein
MQVCYFMADVPDGSKHLNDADDNKTCDGKMSED